jgi:branched-chain amino acid transport system substrate-binding protein
MRFLIAALALTLALPSIPGAATRAADEPFRIDAIVSQTGPAAFLGATETKSLGILESVINKEGGIKGRPIHFVVSDDGSAPATALQIYNQLAQRKPAAFIGTGFTATCNALQPMVKDHGPVMYCLSPSLTPVPGGYGFAGSVWTYYLARVMLRYYRERHWNRIALISSTDASGQEFTNAFNFALTLPEYKNFTLVDLERFNVADVSVAAQMAKIKAANPDMIITWTAGSGFGTLLHGIADGGLTQPVTSCNCNMINAQLAQYKGFMPKELYFPGVRPIVQGAVAKGPVRDAQAVFFGAMKAAGVDKPDMAYILPWDPALLIIDAYRHLGTDATAEQVRDYLLKLHGFAGINGIYDFRDNSNRGIGENNAQMTRWDPDNGVFVAVSKAGGALK